MENESFIQVNEDFLQTHVPNFFIDNYMPTAEPVYSLVYIYLLRHNTGGGAIDISKIAKVFDITEAKCKKALKFWESANLLKSANTSAIKAAEIDSAQKSLKDENEQSAAPEVSANAGISASGAAQTELEERPIYSAQELEAYAQQGIMGDLFAFAQDKLGRMLRYNDLTVIFGMYDWLRLDISVIKKLIEYCAENSHTNINYIEAVSLDWAQRQIKTVQDAENYILTFTKTYREILKAFGITGRNPAQSELEYMERWLTELKVPLEIILEACDKTMLNIGKVNFKYANTIIEFWHKAGVNTIEDIVKLEDAFIKDMPQNEQSDTNKPSRRRKSKFANFEGRKIDYNEIEKLEQEYIDSIVKGY
ncbi:MAG: DnaD domain protein [Clostridiales bacterium]|jgi:DnaD/phage-associated family protein|nr:DnaD domain protein [Clostridiales bacterium]